MANKKEKQEMRNYLGAWVCELANNLLDESERVMTRSEAFRKAHLTRELLERLGEGEVKFKYKKQNGDERTAHGTLTTGIDPMFDNHEYKGKNIEKNYAEDTTNFNYWDLEKHGFRTFSALRLLEINEVRIISCKQPLTEFV